MLLVISAIPTAPPPMGAHSQVTTLFLSLVSKSNNFLLYFRLYHSPTRKAFFKFSWYGSSAYLWSISFWMSLFNSSTFCWSFFLLCSGGRLLKSSGPAPCTLHGEGEKQRWVRAWKIQVNPSKFQFENSRLENLCKTTMVWSTVMLYLYISKAMNGLGPEYLKTISMQCPIAIRNGQQKTADCEMSEPEAEVENLLPSWYDILDFTLQSSSLMGSLIFPAFPCCAADVIPTGSMYWLLLPCWECISPMQI